MVCVKSAVLVPTRWAGTTGAARSSDGVVSIPPFPRFGPCIQSDSNCLDNERNVPRFLSPSKPGHWQSGDRGIGDGRGFDELARCS